ncbi:MULTISPECIES: accessory gene regulator B family protein [Coprobacillaceae]|uniref:accessory gene regulator B family protein n=1 Tax=Coprobacillaceae TaxID=2810280 RepID=UPI000E4FBD5F|nr:MULTISPECIES: accessory gene regulator B family protein [Coprobacillaceae]RHM60907.1 hypothetical protein DWZ53_06290 [Coprobacillus sp. AF33-1AC]RHS94480.1 hypothetical protein DW911_04930 [Erysipelatoclostridium sp. AM42-17]
MNNRLLSKLYRTFGEDQDDLEVLLYGQSVFLFNGFVYLCILIEGFIFKESVYTLLWMFMFTILRSQLGGYHCKKMVSCFCTTNLVYLFGLLINYYKQYTLFYVVFILVLLVVYLFFNRQKVKLQKRVGLIIIIELVLGYLFNICLFPAMISICQNILSFLIRYK